MGPCGIILITRAHGYIFVRDNIRTHIYYRYAGFHFVRCIYALLVQFSNVKLIYVGLVSSKKPNRQTELLEDVFTCIPTRINCFTKGNERML